MQAISLGGIGQRYFEQEEEEEEEEFGERRRKAERRRSNVEAVDRWRIKHCGAPPARHRRMICEWKQ